MLTDTFLFDEGVISSSEDEEDDEALVNDSNANTERPQLGNHVTDSLMLGVTQSPPELYYRLCEQWEAQARVCGWGLVKGVTIVRRVQALSVGLLCFVLNRGNMYNRLWSRVWPQVHGDEALNERLVSDFEVTWELVEDFWFGTSVDPDGVRRAHAPLSAAAQAFFEGAGVTSGGVADVHFVPIHRAVGWTRMWTEGHHSRRHPPDGSLLSAWWELDMRVVRLYRRMPKFVANGKPKMPMLISVKVLPPTTKPKQINKLRSKNDLFVVSDDSDSSSDNDDEAITTGFTALIFANGASASRRSKKRKLQEEDRWGKVVLVGIKSKRKFEEACATLEGILRSCGYSEARLTSHHESNMVYKGSAGHRIDLDRMAHEIQQSYMTGGDRTISLRKPRSSHVVYRFPGLFLQVELFLLGEWLTFTVICFYKGSIVMPGVRSCGEFSSDEVAYRLLKRVKEVVRGYIAAVPASADDPLTPCTGLELKQDWRLPVTGITTTLLTAFK